MNILLFSGHQVIQSKLLDDGSRYRIECAHLIANRLLFHWDWLVDLSEIKTQFYFDVYIAEWMQLFGAIPYALEHNNKRRSLYDEKL